MLKAYCIGIVWRCYKFLTIRQNASLLTYIIPEGGNQERSFNSLLPDYEEALSMKVTPPPSYQVAMQQQQLTVALSPPSDALASPIHASPSESETDPPSYHAAQRLDSSSASSPTNQASLDGSDEIQVEATAAESAHQQQPRDQ